MQFTEQMAKLNRLTKTYQIVFVVGLKIHSPFYNEKLFERIQKGMKVSSITDSIVKRYLAV